MLVNIDSDLAVKYGLNVYIFCSHIAHWVKINKANNRNFHDGKYWTYNSRLAFNRMFPFWSLDQIKKITNDAIKVGLLVSGNYNTSKYDRTLWYTLTDEGCEAFKIPSWQNSQIDLEPPQNQTGENPSPIPKNLNQRTKTQEKIYCSNDQEINKIENHFDDFWEHYPKKQKKQKAYEIWIKNKLYEKWEKICSHVRMRNATEWKSKELLYIPCPDTFLNQRRYDDEIIMPSQLKDKKNNAFDEFMKTTTNGRIFDERTQSEII